MLQKSQLHTKQDSNSFKRIIRVLYLVPVPLYLVPLPLLVAYNIYLAFSTVIGTTGRITSSTVIAKIDASDDKIDQIIDMLESVKAKYYVYNNTNLTLPHIRQRASNPNVAACGLGKQNWFKRFRPYAQGEIRFHEALERHNALITTNISEASFIHVPIPLGAALYWGNESDITGAFQHLFENEPYFQLYPEKHVYLTLIEPLFRSDRKSLDFFHKYGITKGVIQKIQNGILVKDVATKYFYHYITTTPSSENDYNNPIVREETKPVFEHDWSLGYSQEASIPSHKLFVIPPNLDVWRKNKTLYFFYHSRLSASFYNSTQYRHALLANETLKFQVLQPSSIGFDIPYDLWSQNSYRSKFCLIIRGDSPSSRSLYRSIRKGCLPIILSNALPYHQPQFRSLPWNYDDFSIIIDERTFLRDPVRAINDAVTSLTEETLERKIRGLSLLQRMLVLDHPKPLFVQSFIYETIASQQQSYYDFNKNITSI